MNQPINTLTASFDWDTPLDPAQCTAMLTKIADNVIARGMETPIVLFLEIHSPLAPLGAQIGVALSPFIAVWMQNGAFDLQQYVQILRDPKNISELINLIENRSAKPA